jgi:hypothetical protein
VDVQKGIEEFQQTEKELANILNAPDSGEAQKGFDLTEFLQSSSMPCFLTSFILIFLNLYHDLF